MSTAASPLEGVEVVDASRLLPGAHLTWTLQGLGAHVTKLESLDGDGSRHLEPRLDGHSYAMWAHGRGKRSISVDLKDPRGRDVGRRLAARADIFVESFRPGVADRLGIGYADLSASNPAIVYASVSGYAPDGPDARTPGHDINFMAVTGLLERNRVGSDGAPGPLTLPFADLASSMSAATGVLAALLAARAHGAGTHVTVAMDEVVMSLLGNEVAIAAMVGDHEDDSLSGRYGCYTTYRCRDGRWIAVGALEVQFWSAFCTVLGRADLVSMQWDPRTRDELAAVLARLDRGDVLGRFAGIDACVSPVLTVAEAAGVSRTVQDGGDPVPGPSVPIALAGHRAPVRGRPHGLGDDSAEVLAELGYDADEAARLRSSGVVGGPTPDVTPDPV